MRIVDPQSAVLTNIEVLAYLTANPPRRPPNPPPNSRTWVPSPDLRDHNTVVKEIHNYISRLSPHVLDYPRYTPLGMDAAAGQTQTQTQTQTQAGTQSQSTTAQPPPRPAAVNEQMPIDDALRNLITRLQPYGLTKGEVLMIVNLGVGVQTTAPGEGEHEQEDEQEQTEAAEGEDAEMANGTGEEMDVDAGDANGEAVEGEGEEGDGEVPEEDYGPLALLDTVIEERDERLGDEEVRAVLAIIRETLGGKG